MFPELPVDIAATVNAVEFRFREAVSLFILVVSRGDRVLWELVANEGQRTEASEFSLISMTPVEQATEEMLETVRKPRSFS